MMNKRATYWTCKLLQKTIKSRGLIRGLKSFNSTITLNQTKHIELLKGHIKQINRAKSHLVPQFQTYLHCKQRGKRK